jgi:hypothetical protein
MNLEWNVFYHNVNKNKIETFNIFNHWKFAEDVQKYLKKFKDKDEFAEELRRDLFYYFGSKCEYEVIITSFPTYITMNELDRLNHERWTHKDRYGTDYVRISANLDTEIKIDIYTQVMNNFNIFLEYVWDSKRRRNKKAVKNEEN